ncbi:MAG: radical SAM protein [Ruminococcus sp.]|nr:radical SAM protein [Ruminococcus sp.]
MIINTRACISINNRCNLDCLYCHFHTPEKSVYIKKSDMNIFIVLDNIINHIEKYNIPVFKLGFVGNGEPLLDYASLREYIIYIGDYIADGRISAYTITNATLLNAEMLEFFRDYKINAGFSIDGIPEIHNRYRCNTHDTVMNAVEMFRIINGHYPAMNCTVSRDTISRTEETIAFFERFGSRVTFSRMIGKNGITLAEFRKFLDKAESTLNVRRGGYDCTMYGGMCGAGINNIFYADGKAYICGNCIDLPATADYDTPLDMITPDIPTFDRNKCFREIYRGDKY